MKKILSILLTFSILVICCSNTMAAARPVYCGEYASGDVSGDGEINAQDALLVLQYAVDKITLSKEAVSCADVSYNSRIDDSSPGIDAQDALLILQRAVRKIRGFPCQIAFPA